MMKISWNLFLVEMKTSPSWLNVSLKPQTSLNSILPLPGIQWKKQNIPTHLLVSWTSNLVGSQHLELGAWSDLILSLHVLTTCMMIKKVGVLIYSSFLSSEMVTEGSTLQLISSIQNHMRMLAIKIELKMTLELLFWKRIFQRVTGIWGSTLKSKT